MAKRKGLGRGLNALISEIPIESTPADSEQSEKLIALHRIIPNEFQPRTTFEDAPLDDLIASIREHGILQPLVVRPKKDHYELIAGERRLRASTKAGLSEVPVRIIEINDQGALELALIENLQREDLSILDEAEGYRLLMDQFGLTQENVAKKVSKARATVANALRILGLSDTCKTLLASKKITAGHAKILLSLDSTDQQDTIAQQIAREGLSVRASEKLIAQIKKIPRKPRAERSDIPKSHLDYLSEKLHAHLSTSVRVIPSKTLSNGKKSAGRLEIDYFSSDELDRLLTILGLSEEL